MVAVCNQKGGVGKTTTALNLASVLADSSGRVQVVVDPGLASMGIKHKDGRRADRGGGVRSLGNRAAVAARWRVLINYGRRGVCSG